MPLVRTTLFLGCALWLLAPSVFAQADAAPASGDEYGGPAILSRGQSAATQGETPVAFRPYVGVSGIYDTGLVPVAVTSTGQIPSSDIYGVELNLGAYTYRTWKHTSLGLDYRGNFRHYPDASYWDGTDQFLSLIFTDKVSKRVTVTLREQGGTYSRSYSLSSTLGALDPNYLQVPISDIYDNRVIFVGSSGDLTYQKSARLSFSFGGEGSLVRRRSSALYGVTAGIARADMEYRISRHSTIGLDYRFVHYDYTKGFGTTDIHSVGVNYSTALSPHVQFSARLGGARADSSTLEVVTLDPAVAALLGVTTGIQAAYRLNYVPDIQARLSDTFRRSQLALSYINTVVPGNGVFVTSRNNSINGSYNYSGVRYWNFGADASYGRMSTLVQTIGAYTSYGGGVGVTRELGKGMHVVLRLDARHYDISSGSLFAHTEYRATLGFAYSPGDIPLKLW